MVYGALERCMRLGGGGVGVPLRATAGVELVS